MSDFEATKGPWSICGLISGPMYVGAPRPGNPARMDSVLSGNNAIANARLISAAPDMLAALRKAQDWLDLEDPTMGPTEKATYRRLITQIDAAIEKALGQ